jgi:hypothetical protein
METIRMTISTAKTNSSATKCKPPWRATNNLLVTKSSLPCASITTCKQNKEGRNSLRPGFADLTETLYLDSRPGCIPAFHVVEEWALGTVDGCTDFDFSDLTKLGARKYRAFNVTHEEARDFYRRARTADRARLFVDVERLIEARYDCLFPVVTMLDEHDLLDVRRHADREGKTLDGWVRKALNAAVLRARKQSKSARTK